VLRSRSLQDVVSGPMSLRRMEERTSVLRRGNDGGDHVTDHIGLFPAFRGLGVSSESVEGMFRERRRKVWETHVLVEAKTSAPSGSERSTSALDDVMSIFLWRYNRTRQ
jgi:hypothetical protein